MPGKPRAETPGSFALCAGKACRKRDEYNDLRTQLGAEGDLGRFPCVGICAGPVVVVRPPTGAPLVVERVRSSKVRRDLVRLMRGRKPSDRIRRRLVTGSKRDKAVRRATNS